MTLTTSPARATDETTDLEKSLAEEHAALSTSDCTVACRALASIRRAADKICALEPGPRCDAARTKANDATRRVREACPDCAVAAMPSSPTTAPESAPRSASAPPAEGPSGGCRSCSMTDGGGGGGGGDLGIVLVAAYGALRRSRRRRVDRSDGRRKA